MKRKMWKKLLCLTLAAVLLVLAFPVLAEETAENEAKYQAYASVALKVRREPRKDSSGKGSIPKDSLVSILELLDSGCDLPDCSLTAKMAQLMGREWALIEPVENYCNIARARLESIR